MCDEKCVMNIIFNSLLSQLVKYDVHTTSKIKIIHAIFICSIAIAYSMGQIIKSVCVCVCVCVCVNWQAYKTEDQSVETHQTTEVQR